MKIIIPTIGTRGDIQPYLALSQGLITRGHDVILMSHHGFSKLAARYDVPFASMGPDIDLEHLGADIRGRSRNWLASMLRTMRFSRHIQEQSIDDICRQAKDADLVLVSHSGAGSIAADKCNIPKISTTLMPMAIPANDPNTNRAVKAASKLVGFGMDMIMARPINKIRHRQGLPSMGQAGITSNLLNLIPISPLVFPPNPLWEERHKMTGYWFLNEKNDWQPPDELADFLESGEKPFLVSLGAMSSGKDSLSIAQTMIQALKHNGIRAIIQGWHEAADLLADNKFIFHSPAVPHSWLLQQVRAIVHHGGFGTTAAALRAGIPSLVIPHILDQFIWGSKIFELGAGPKPIRRTKISQENLNKAIHQLYYNDDFEQKAAALGQQIRKDNGVKAAVDLIEKTMNSLV